MNRVNTKLFYAQYQGHPITHLETIYNQIHQLKQVKRIVYLAGDSSLDNKYWLNNYLPAVNGYEQILNSPQMKPDISYHMNNIFSNSNPDYVVINTSVEASTITERTIQLYPQDQFIQEHISDNDILIVSIGGNDIALSPSMKTIFNMAMMMYMNSIETIKKGPDFTWGMNHFINMFRDQIKNYIMKIIGDKKPHKIIVCMIYYPDEQSTGSWADRVLGYLGYNNDPQKLQAAIHQLFTHATRNISISGCQVVPFAMHRVLDGKNTSDYVQRVEPSAIGGKKLAKAFVKCCLK